MTVHKIDSIDSVMAQPFGQRLRTRDVRLLLRRYEDLTLGEQFGVSKILLDLEHDRNSCNLHGIVYADLTMKNPTEVYGGIEVLRALATKEYLIIHS